MKLYTTLRHCAEGGSRSAGRADDGYPCAMTVTAPRLPDAALAHWDLGQIYRMQRVQTGLMNRSWRVDTATGAYLMKLFRDVT